MKKFFIITNPEKDKDLLITGQIEEYIGIHGGTCSVYKAGSRREGPYHYTDPACISEGTECVIVLGGDGTLLQAARDLVRLGIPMIGINLGNLGYLAEVDRHSVYPALDKLFCDHAEIEERMMLRGTVYRKDQVLKEEIALNDIVISRDGPLRVVRFKNYVNNEFLNSYNADGVIISTPTGSTGYSLSAGGPIVAPEGSMIIMTPVAPHTINARSIVFPDEDVVTVEIGEGRRSVEEKAVASFDGDVTVPVVTGDRIVIRKAKEKTRILKLNHLNFVEILRQKMRDNAG